MTTFRSNTLLSAREIEVLTRVAMGMTNIAIAAELNIAQRTVEQHITHILDKIGVHNRTSAVLWAVRMGIIQTE